MNRARPTITLATAGLSLCLLASLMAWPAAADPGPSAETPAIPATEAPPAPPVMVGPEGPPMPVSLSISGGVSLGAYEAGVTWGAVRYLRAWGDDRSMRPDPGDGPVSLVGITGASAGAINTLVTALSWCSKPQGLGRPGGNLLRDLWLGVGFDGLLPPDGEGFLPLDGAMTRAAFVPGMQELQAAIDRTDFRPHCRVPIAFTVTRGVPWELKLAGLVVANQRFAVPLELVIDAEGRAWFRNHVEVLRNEAMLGQYLFLAERTGAEERTARGRTGGTPPDRVVPADMVIQAMLASSAFPLAFSPVPLVTCLPVDRCPDEHPPAPSSGFGWLGCGERESCDDFSALTCDGLSDPGQPQAPCTSRFVDGGFFDNVPLGVAMAQAELQTPDLPQRRPVDYLYFDPDVRRLSEASDQFDDLGDRGFARIGSILGDVATTARSYELSTVLRFARFNRALGWYSRRFGDLLERSVEVTVEAGREPTGDARSQLGAPLAACLDALAADGETCLPLPPACMALAATEPTPQPPTGDAAACLPRASATLITGLRRLGRRLDCNARGEAHAPSFMRDLPGIQHHVNRWFGGLVLCRERAGVTSMLHARLVRDLAEARETTTQMRRSVAPARTLSLPRRFAELAAGQVRNFGAFFDGPLRRHDYAVGLYDAVRGIAGWHCNTRAAIEGKRHDLRSFWACVEAGTAGVRAAIGVDEVPALAAIADGLSALERAAMALELGDPMPAADPWARCPDDDDGPCAVQRALIRCAPGDGRVRVRLSGGEVCLGQPDMDDFVAALRAEGYRPESTYMTRLLEDPRWWTAMAERLLARLAAIEESEADRAGARASSDVARADVHREAEANARGNRVGFLAGGSVLRAAYPDAPGFDPDPSTIPDDAGFHITRLLPYRVGFGLMHGGVTVGWEPHIGARALHLRLGIEPLAWEGREHGMAAQFSPLLALRPWSSVAWGALGLGARLHRPWSSDEAWGLGGVVALDLIADRLRIDVEVGLARFGGEVPANEADVPVLITVSLLDLPGLLWLASQ